ncbi:hypothetical protein BJX70DRAFT_403392 [Aspergillus crustosus]
MVEPPVILRLKHKSSEQQHIGFCNVKKMRIPNRNHVTLRINQDIARAETGGIETLLVKALVASFVTHQPLQVGLRRATRTLPSNAPAKAIHFLFSVHEEEHAERIRKHLDFDVKRATVLVNEPLRAMKDAHIVILALDMGLEKDILCQEGVYAALSGKLVVSFLHGFTISRVSAYIHGGGEEGVPGLAGPFVVRATTNHAARVCKALTVIEAGQSLPLEQKNLLTWMFELVGTVKYLDSARFISGSFMTELCMAIVAMTLDGISLGCRLDFDSLESMEMEVHVLNGLVALMRERINPKMIQALTPTGNSHVYEILEKLKEKGISPEVFISTLVTEVQNMWDLERETPEAM